MTEIMRIKQIKVNNLFGMFNHTISLKLKDRITIMIGENGIGKTIILRLINDIFHNDFSKNVIKIPFDSLEIEFDNEIKLVLEKKAFSNKLNVILYVPNEETQKKELSYEKIIKQVKISNPFNETKYAFEDIIKSINVDLIETQRLIKFNRKNTSPIQVKELESMTIAELESMTVSELTQSKALESITVDELAKNLAAIIESKLAEFADFSQDLERTFPSRLIEFKQTLIDESNIKERLKKLSETSRKLSQTGILRAFESLSLQQKVEDSTLDDAQKKALSIYIEDTEKKLAIFDELSKKIELFRDIINKRFEYKKIFIDKDKGFYFKKEINGKIIEEIIKPADLSSGEQHELVLIYKLLFDVKPNSFVMIDEPEISLDIEWQMDFLDDFKKIVKLSQIDILIATHSPIIINDRWDLTASLKGNDNE